MRALGGRWNDARRHWEFDGNPTKRLLELLPPPPFPRRREEAVKGPNEFDSILAETAQAEAPAAPPGTIAGDTFRRAKLFRFGRPQAVRLPKEFRVEGRGMRIRRHGASAAPEPVAADWRWLDDIAGAFSEDFFAEGRAQPELPPMSSSRCR